MFIVSRLCASNPGSTCNSRLKLRRSSPAAISNTSASAIWPTTSSALVFDPERPSDADRPSARRVAFKSIRTSCTAGKMPNKMPASTEICEGKKKDTQVEGDWKPLRYLGRSPGCECPRSYPADAHADGTGDESQHHALREELAHDCTAACTNGRACCDFALPGECTRKQKACDVCAGDEQNDCDCAEQHKNLGPHIAYNLIAQAFGRHHGGRRSIGGGWILLSVTLIQQCQFVIGFCDGGSGTKACNDVEVSNAHSQPLRRHQRKLKVTRRKDVRLRHERKAGICREDADNCTRY